MKTYKSFGRGIGVGLLAALVLLIFAQADDASADFYDLGTDWSDTANPNGPWSYNDGGGPITTHVDNWNSGELGLGQPAWADEFIPCWFKSTKTHHDFLPGDIVTHLSSPGYSGPSHITWTSPIAGTIDQISGAVWLARDIGRAVDWELRISEVVVSDGSLSSGDAYDRANPFDLATGSGGADALTDIPVAAGDEISLYFIRPPESPYGDYTGVTFSVQFASIPDTDGDGLQDDWETRDLDPGTGGVQNPFDPNDPDSTGNEGQNTPDGVPDGSNDYDGDEMSNRDEFTFGYDPLDPNSWADVPFAAWPVAAVLLCVGVLVTGARAHKRR